MDWNIHQSIKDWVTLEHKQLSHNLTALPWIHPNDQHPAIKLHPLLGLTLEIFREVFKTNNPTPWLGPLAPLRDNPDFLPGLEQNFLSKIWPHRVVLSNHFSR